MTLGEFKKHDAELGMPSRCTVSPTSVAAASGLGHRLRAAGQQPALETRSNRTHHRHGSGIGDGDCERDPPKRELAVVIIGKPVRHEFPEPRLRAKVESMELILIEQGFARVVFQLATATGRSIYPPVHHD